MQLRADAMKAGAPKQTIGPLPNGVYYCRDGDCNNMPGQGADDTQQTESAERQRRMFPMNFAVDPQKESEQTFEPPIIKIKDENVSNELKNEPQTKKDGTISKVEKIEEKKLDVKEKKEKVQSIKNKIKESNTDASKELTGRNTKNAKFSKVFHNNGKI